jgi:hypothetical protein
MRHIWNRRQLDLESELRASRQQPRADFVQALADEVRSRPRERTRAGRIGLAFSLSGLIVVLLASFGGIGYASSAASHAVKKPTVAKHARIASKSAAQAQYAPFTPPKAKVTAATHKAKPKTIAAAAAGQAKAKEPTAPVTAAQLPFTGLALWMPLAIGVLLLATGLVLRTRSRRRNSAAHS